MTIPPLVKALVQRFDRHVDQYMGKGYKETPVRRDFVDPLFEALGWDMQNRQGLPETTREVLHEDSLKIGTTLRAPDYCFRIGQQRKFFVESKRPSEDIANNAMWAFQLRRYGWSARVPLSILTDFEEFAIYDCRVRPHKSDGPAVARLDYFKYNELEAKWPEIEAVFSRQAVLAGSFDAFVEKRKKVRGTAEVDEAFLDQMDAWRDALARNLALRNSLEITELNFAVQQIIDRIVFLRICEDRGIEKYGRLQAAAESDGVFQVLSGLFLQADDRYNSGLFHFRKETGRSEPPDALTLGLDVDDKPLREIIKGLYYPESPYEFSVLSTDILGQVYEQFLGKTIRLTASGRAVVEEKKELKKAGGIYYTPSFISEYIVEKAIGPFVEGSTPRRVSRLRILDPACGSGSFLIRAFDYLLSWHLNYYLQKDPTKYPNEIYQVSRDIWRLSTQEKKRILLNNIFGVDVDPQAVEVTKLSLLLKLMEGETAQSVDVQLQLLHERALPDLGRNIKSGNSLIDTLPRTNGQLNLLESEAIQSAPFVWSDEFATIFAEGGFGIIIGNPPYRRELDYKYLMDEIAATPLGARYRMPRMDLWYYFVHRGLEILRAGGVLSFITNAYWTSGTGARKLIDSLEKDAHVDELFAFNKLKVFRKVAGQHMIMRVTKGTSKGKTLIKVVSAGAKGSAEPYVLGREPANVFEKRPAELFRSGKVDLQPPDSGLLKKLSAWPPLENFGKVRQGIAENPASVNAKTIRRLKGKWKSGEGVFSLSQRELTKLRVPAKERVLLREYHDLSDLGRYFKASTSSRTLIFSTKVTCPDIDDFPTIRKHLERFRPIMEGRRETKKKLIKWWQLHWPRDEALWQASKVISLQMSARPSFVAAAEPTYVPFSVNVFVPSQEVRESVYYFEAILNSKVLWKWFQHFAKRRGVALEINGNVLSRAPIRPIDFSNAADVAKHDRITTLALHLETAAAAVAGATVPSARTNAERQFRAFDEEMDRLIAELYGLKEEEILEVNLATASSASGKV